MRIKRVSKTLSLFLAFCMVFTMLPTEAFAKTFDVETGTAEDELDPPEELKVTVTSGSAIAEPLVTVTFNSSGGSSSSSAVPVSTSNVLANASVGSIVNTIQNARNNDSVLLTRFILIHSFPPVTNLHQTLPRCSVF